MKCYLRIILVECLLFLVSFQVCVSQNDEEPETCEVDGISGACLPLPACPQYLKLIKDSSTMQEGLRVTQTRRCGFDGPNLKVCCPAEEPVPTPQFKFVDTDDFVDELPNTDVCGQKKLRAVGHAYNGKPVTPSMRVNWMAVLGYKDAPVFWQCGGTIITAKHVLTAAHCIRRNLYVVRVGQLDLASKEQDSKAIDFLVKKAIRHEEYTKYHNDIAVVVLDGSIDFKNLDLAPICLPVWRPDIEIMPRSRSTFVTGWGETEKHLDLAPICLPVWRPDIEIMPRSRSTFVTGWGETEKQGHRPTQLLYAPVHHLELELCARAYGGQNVTIDERVLCAGDAQGEHDACNGDSGGPLVQEYDVEIPRFMYSFPYYYQLGVISYGFRCSARRFLGLYTNVAYFMPWIQEKVLGKVAEEF